MFDIYAQLVVVLENRNSADKNKREKNRQDIKRIAEKLSEQAVTIEDSFDAAFCYYISGYYVHAQVLTNVDFKSIHPIQRWILYFLAKRFRELKVELSDVVNNTLFQDTSIQDGIYAATLNQFDVVNRIIEVKVAEGFLDIISFIEAGDLDKYTHAIDIFSACQKLLYKAGEWQIWWWLETLKIIGQEFVDNSLWQRLQPMCDNPTNADAVSKYITANYEKLTIIEFWRTQIECLPKINDPERCSFCISVPTSAGKTKAAELAILRFVLDYDNEPNAKCVYIAPLRALCEEIEQTLAKVFRQDGKSTVSKFYGGHEIDIFDEHFWSQTRILVVTPEKLDGMLRQYPKLKKQIKLVVADEGHLIGEKDRLTYRFLLERLIYIFRKQNVVAPQKPRIILMSGVLPKIEDFAELISGSKDNVVNIDWRPTEEPKFFKWVWNGQGWASWKFDGQKWQPSTPPIPEQVQDCNSQDRFADQVVKTAVSQSKSDNAVMVFSAHRAAIEKQDFMALLTCVAQHNPYGSLESINPKLKAKYPNETLLLENRMSIHHFRVPSEIKQEIDARVRSGRVRLLFASPTYAQGVNMPFDSVLIYKLHHGYLPISPSMFWNVVGRVGRPIAQMRSHSKVEAPKVVFLLNQSSEASSLEKQSTRICDEFMSERRKYEVASPFLDFLNEIRRKLPTLDISKLVSELAEKPKLKDIIGENASDSWGKITLEQCLSKLDNHLIALSEEVDVEITLEWAQQSVKEIVDLFAQASVINDGDFDYISEVVFARLKFIAKHISKDRRRQEYLLGLPYEDCEMIKQNADKLLVWYQDCIGLFDNNRETGTDNLVSLVMFAMNLSICKKGGRKTRKDKSKQSGQMSFDLKIDDKPTRSLKRLLGSWINGESGDDLLSTHQEFNKYRELERNLPWGISAIARYLNAIAKEKEPKLSADLEYLPSMVKYGVNSKIACHLMRRNIPRKFAVAIVDLYRDKLSRVESDEMEFSFDRDSLEAVKSLRSLTDEQIGKLEIDQSTKEIIQRICEQHKTSSNEKVEPEAPPSEMEFVE